MLPFHMKSFPDYNPFPAAYDTLIIMNWKYRSKGFTKTAKNEEPISKNPGILNKNRSCYAGITKEAALMKMKKWLAVLMTLAVTTAGLAGCGASDKPGSTAGIRRENGGGGNRIRGNRQQ